MLKFTKTNKDGSCDIVLLTDKNEVKSGTTSNKTHIMAQPWKKQYKQHAAALTKFQKIMDNIINEDS